MWHDPGWGGALRGKILLPAQPFMPARLPTVPGARVQWLTLSGAGTGLQ